MKPDFSDYIIAVLLELDDGLPHSMDQCVDGVYDKCDIEYEIPLIGHYLKRSMQKHRETMILKLTNYSS